MLHASLSLASFFSIEARDYTSFTFDAGARATARNVILAFAVGILLAALYAFYQKNVPGSIVRAILRAEAFDESSAKTAAELGLGKNVFLLFELKHNATLKKLVTRVSREAAEGETAEEAYYIPEELKYRAEVRYEKEGNGPMALIVTAVLTVVLAILLIRLMPTLLTVADNLLK